MPDKNFVTLDGDRWGEKEEACEGASGPLNKSFSTPITSFGARGVGTHVSTEGNGKA